MTTCHVENSGFKLLESQCDGGDGMVGGDNNANGLLFAKSGQKSHCDCGDMRGLLWWVLVSRVVTLKTQIWKKSCEVTSDQCGDC